VVTAYSAKFEVPLGIILLSVEMRVYYVRQSDKTRFLFNSFLLMADMIIVHGSHQQYLNALLAEHSSLTGLKVKTLGVKGYPGRWDYHNRGRYDYLRAGFLLEKQKLKFFI
jgi:hypothetical protein